ncbi:uncharacterized protein G2W53_042069 [Senna tora]|uniref:Uncharacterized protein n=1 Tax=Senna tora TaxID=362788 RepID=A0A834SFL9_9FABA|nr:uncharacterized protein G2W53_042069 [Senna tora]
MGIVPKGMLYFPAVSASASSLEGLDGSSDGIWTEMTILRLKKW